MNELTTQYAHTCNLILTNVVSINKASLDLKAEQDRLGSTYRIDAPEFTYGMEKALKEYHSSADVSISLLKKRIEELSTLLTDTPFDPADPGMLVAIQLVKDQNTPDGALITIADKYGSNSQAVELLYNIGTIGAKSFLRPYLVKTGDIDSMKQAVSSIEKSENPYGIYSGLAEIVRVIRIISNVKKLDINTQSDALEDIKYRAIASRMGLDIWMI